MTGNGIRYPLRIWPVLTFVVPVLLSMVSCSSGTSPKDLNQVLPLYSDGRPYTRWWWFASVIDTQDVKYQLDWFVDHGFGGVEIAWVYPYEGDTAAERYSWLSEDWTRAVVFAREYANRIGLGCDFTFGTLWPFGDSKVPQEEAGLQYGKDGSERTMRLTWEHPVRGRVINHLDRTALEHYSDRVGKALAPALTVGPTALFCDSWEVETRKIWSGGLDTAFCGRFGYDITLFMDSLYLPGYEAVFYDYLKLVSDLVIREFYIPFTGISHYLGCFSRAQCGGAPTDLVTAFASVDIPETEAILFEPSFALIPVSAAILAGKSIVSSETFTCLYGWKGWPGPGPYQGEEQVADLKRLVDALFAHGVNQIIWHGTPYNGPGGNQRFYASVHTAPGSKLEADLLPFNLYLTQVSQVMRKGKPYTEVAIYLPLEDAWMGVEYPDSLKFPWAWGEYEMRYVRPPEQLKGYQPIWINSHFLETATVDNGRLYSGDASFSLLYVDVKYLDMDGLKAIQRIAVEGLPVCIRNMPLQPGYRPDKDYEPLLNSLINLPNVSDDPAGIWDRTPLVSGEDIPDFFCRHDHDTAWIFFAHPVSEDLKYPLEYGGSYQEDVILRQVRLRVGSLDTLVELKFQPYRSLLALISGGRLDWEPLTYIPPVPEQLAPQHQECRDGQ